MSQTTKISNTDLEFWGRLTSATYIKMFLGSL